MCIPRNAKVAGLLVAAACLVSGPDAFAFCRTVTCPLPAGWSPSDSSCYPATWAKDGCPTSMPAGARVVPVWWRNACVSYDVQKNASRWADYATVARLVEAAFAKWTGAMCSTDAAGTSANVSIKASNLGPVDCGEVGYNQSGGPNQHVIVFRDSMWPHPNDASNTLGLTTVTFEADTGEIYDADTEINGTLPLSVGDPVTPGSYDLESIITHEMGHFLGLAHSRDPVATMYAQYNQESTMMRTLKADDTAGLCTIYPPGGTRSVDPSAGPGGSVPADGCDPTPRHGFSSLCAQPPKSGCSVASRDAPGPTGGAVFTALAWIGVARARKRPPRQAAARRS
jgi:hypothetical protein